MAAPVQIRAVYVVAEELHPIEPQELPATFGHGELNLRIVTAILSMSVIEFWKKPEYRRMNLVTCSNFLS